MPAFSRVFSRVFIRRIVAAERYPALLARSKVNPTRADLDALLADALLRMFDGGDCLNVGADAVRIHRSILARKRKRQAEEREDRTERGSSAAACPTRRAGPGL